MTCSTARTGLFSSGFTQDYQLSFTRSSLGNVEEFEEGDGMDEVMSMGTGALVYQGSNELAELFDLLDSVRTKPTLKIASPVKK